MKTTIKKLGLLVAMLFTILQISAYDFEVDGIYYNIISTENLTCSMTYGDKKYTNDIEIPATVEWKGRTLSVIQIGPEAFNGCNEIEKIRIPDNIREIGRSAFCSCYGLKTIEISDSVRTIGSGAFRYCTSLENINLPNNDSFWTIEYETFYSCEKLKSITIPSYVHMIDDGAFSYCYELESVIVPDPYYYIRVEDYAFQSCTKLKDIPTEYIYAYGKSSFKNCKSIQEAIIIPLVIELYDETFAGCTSLNSVIFESGEEKLTINSGDPSTFKDCPNLYNLSVGRNISVKYDQDFKLVMPNITKLTILPNYGGFCLIKFPQQIKDMIFTKDTEDIFKSLIWDIFFPHYRLETLTVEYVDPPSIKRNNGSNDYAFSESEFFNVILYVPEESIDKYQNAEGWKYFWNIEPINENNAVESVGKGQNNIEVCRYSLDGSKIDSTYKGIAIVKYSDGSTKKIVQK